MNPGDVPQGVYMSMYTFMCTCVCVYNSTRKEVWVIVTVLSVAGHGLQLYLDLFYFSLQICFTPTSPRPPTRTSAAHCLLPCGGTSVFLSEGSESFLVLSLWGAVGCHSFLAHDMTVLGGTPGTLLGSRSPPPCPYCVAVTLLPLKIIRLTSPSNMVTLFFFFTRWPSGNRTHSWSGCVLLAKVFPSWVLSLLTGTGQGAFALLSGLTPREAVALQPLLLDPPSHPWPQPTLPVQPRRETKSIIFSMSHDVTQQRFGRCL